MIQEQLQTSSGLGGYALLQCECLLFMGLGLPHQAEPHATFKVVLNEKVG